MEHEQLIPGVLKSLQLILSIANGVIISYTRQERLEFVQHLTRFGIVNNNMFDADAIHTVGTNGKKSREAKAEAIQKIYGEKIKLQKASGLKPMMVGDSITDMKAAFDSCLDFVGLTETGKSNSDEFHEAFEAISLSHPGLTMTLFPSLAHNDCIDFVMEEANKQPA